MKGAVRGILGTLGSTGDGGPVFSEELLSGLHLGSIILKRGAGLVTVCHGRSR